MAREREYKCTIKNATRELSTKEKIQIKDLSDATNLYDYIQSNPEGLVMDMVFMAELEIHNPKSSNPDYTVYLYMDKDGNKFYSGSESLYTKVADIYDELKEAGESTDIVPVKIFGKPSKNYQGRDFISAVLI